MDDLKLLSSTGFSLPSGSYLIGSLLFGVIGFAAWRYGRSTARTPVKWIGVALMVYPYAIDETWVLYTAGAALCCALFIWRRQD